MRWLVLIAIAACGAAPVCPLVPRPAVTQPFLWKVQKDGGAIVWLYGTIHNASGDDVPKAAWDAFESSPTVVTEVGDVTPDPAKTRKLAFLASGKGLDQQLPANDWYDLRDALRGSSMKEADLKRARPWFAMARLSVSVAPPPKPTMDFAITERARASGKTVDALESVEAQLAALAEAVKIPDLQQAIHERRTLRCSLDKMKSIYMTGDLAAMTTLLVIEQTNTLVVERSKAWMTKLGPYFAHGAFVAVGLGHLAGPDGLPAMLQRAGYRVERAP